MVTKREKRILEREEGLPKGKRLKSGANDTTTKEEEKEKVDKKMSSSSQKIVLTSTKESPSGSSLDSEVQKRRQRMLAWRQQRQLKQQQLHDSRGGTNGTHSAFGADDDANSRRPGANAASNLWSLEDEDDDGGEHEEEEEEGNPSKSGDPSRMENEEDEIDPLDAFMAAEVLPEVERLKKLADDDTERIETNQSNKTGTTTTPDGGVHSKKTSSTDEITQGEHEDGDGDEDGEGNERNMAEASKKSSGDGEPNTAKERRKTLINLKAESKTQKSKTKTSSSGSEVKTHRKKKVKYFYDSESSDWSSEEERESEDDEEWAKNVVSGKGSKLEKLIIVDHSKIDYIKFRKNFFIESPEITKMSPQEVTAYRKVLDNIKVRGKNVPKPIKGWHQCGLSTRILQVIQALDFEKPTPIQCQALPIIMQGRDCIGIAKTGSGKTMAFVLPMLRHINDQPYLKPGEGPIGIIMAPTRELVQQIGKDIKKFAKNVNLRLVCVYGGSGVADQIAALKRGAEIVVCTPGRLIDILAMGAGNRITNMRRVTYMVLDEADRMFDMGFEPQIKRILNMVRPDRQTVMFSATFPKQVETLARLALTKPVEILVGGRSIVNLDIEQIIEVRPEEQRFLRLLELLGHWYERGKVLVFVKSQERCDNLFRDLLKAGYPCMSLHGGKDQSDRECTINDFKSDVCNVLVATSVAARGLDVKDLQLVVNYDVPNHHEDYVHRVGRTGRAGKKGTAVTFIAPDEEKYAPDLVKALKESGKPVPYALQDMADDFTSKLKQGLVQGHGSGFGGSGFKFDEEEDKKQKMQRKRIQAQYGTVEEESGSDQSDPEDDSDDDIRMTHAQKPPQQPPQPPTTQPGAVQEAGEGEKSKMAGNSDQAKSVVAKTTHNESSGTPSNQQQEEDPRKKILLEAARKVISNIEREAGFVAGANPTDAASRAAIFAAKLVAAQQGGLDGTAALALASAAANSAAIALAASGTGAMTGNANNHNNNNPHANHDAEVAEHYNTEIEINDFPQLARWKVSNKEAIFRMSSEYNVAITAKGIYVPPNKAPKSGERKLYLLIEGPMERGVKLCKTEIKKIIQEYTEKTLMSGSRYQI